MHRLLLTFVTTNFRNEGKITLEEAAKENSTCPSGAEGGDLGAFGPGQMVPEFDYRLLEITEHS